MALAFIAAALYLLQFRELKARRFGQIFQLFPPLERLDQLNRFALVAGFPTLTLGVLLASPLYADLAPPGVSFIAFALFIGVAMSITAFPVLARILTDGRMAHTELGVTALTCAAVDDVTAWCLLAFVAGVARAAVGDALMVVLLTLGFIGVMFLIARPLAARALARTDRDPPSHEAIALTFVGVLASALTTERIGIHAIFGAFLFGDVGEDRSDRLDVSLLVVDRKFDDQGVARPRWLGDDHFPLNRPLLLDDVAVLHRNLRGVDLLARLGRCAVRWCSSRRRASLAGRSSRPG